MKFLLTSCVLFAALFALAPAPPSPFEDECVVLDQNLYKGATAVPKIQIDMSLAPYYRWQKVAVQYKPQILNLLKLLIDRLSVVFPNFETWLDSDVSQWNTMIPQPYRDEIQGIADALGLPVGQIVIYNLFYEVHSMCTAIVAVDQNNNVIKGRNMDFGMWMGFEPFNGDYQWVLTQRLIPVAVQTEYFNGNVTTGIQSLTFVGYVGIFEGFKQGKFSISMNTRFNRPEGGIFQIMLWLMGLRPNATFNTFLLRETLFEKDTFQDAKVNMLSREIMAPCYYTLAGVQPSEGAMVARGPKDVEWLTEMGLNSDPNWYILQTNYDPDKPVLYLDNRRGAGHKCMDKMGQSNVNFANIYTVLTSKSTLNKQTVVTVLTDVKNGKFEMYSQNCPDPCWFT